MKDPRLFFRLFREGFRLLADAAPPGSVGRAIGEDGERASDLALGLCGEEENDDDVKTIETTAEVADEG